MPEQHYHIAGPDVPAHVRAIGQRWSAEKRRYGVSFRASDERQISTAWEMTCPKAPWKLPRSRPAMLKHPLANPAPDTMHRAEMLISKRIAGDAWHMTIRAGAADAEALRPIVQQLIDELRDIGYAIEPEPQRAAHAPSMAGAAQGGAAAHEARNGGAPSKYGVYVDRLAAGEPESTVRIDWRRFIRETGRILKHPAASWRAIRRQAEAKKSRNKLH